MACRACHRFCLFTILYTATYPLTPLFLNIPVSSSHPLPHSSRSSLNDGRTSTLPGFCRRAWPNSAAGIWLDRHLVSQSRGGVTTIEC